MTPTFSEMDDQLPQPMRGSQDTADKINLLLRQAVGYKTPKMEAFQRWREYFLMMPPQPIDSRVPTVSTPVVRQKADGIRAHIKVAIDKVPFFTVRPMTEDAANAAPALESIMQRELEATGSLWEIERAVDDAVIFGTGVLMIEETMDGENPRIALRHVPIRNVYAWPERAEPDKLTWFRVFYMPYWEMVRLAQAGVYDSQAVDKVRQLIASPIIPYDQEQFSGQATLDEELRWHQLVEVWMVENGSLKKIIYHPAGQEIFSQEIDPFGETIKRPPFFPIYIDPDHYEIWGHGIAEVVAQFQTVADVAMNAEVASTQYKSYPPMLVKANSQVHRALQKGKTLLPGQVLPYDGPDAEEVLKILQYSVNPFNVQLLNIMNQLTEDATVSDFIVPGQPMGGRKTATEVNITATIGQLKLQNYLRHVIRGLEEVGRWYWKAIVEEVREANEAGLPKGVTKTFSYSGGVKPTYLAYRTVDLQVQGADGGLYQVYIPGVERDDIEWRLTGDATVAEREMRMNRLMSLLNPAVVQLMQVAKQDPGIYHLLRRLFEALGMGYDVTAILGPEPQQMSPATNMLMSMLGSQPDQGGQGGQGGPQNPQ